MAAGQRLPTSGNVFITMTDPTKADIVPIAKMLSELGFGILATQVRQSMFFAFCTHTLTWISEPMVS